jgi:hypothetical protein
MTKEAQGFTTDLLMCSTSLGLTHHAAFEGPKSTCLCPAELESSYLVPTVSDTPPAPASGFLPGKHIVAMMIQRVWGLRKGPYSMASSTCLPCGTQGLSDQSPSPLRETCRTDDAQNRMNDG